MSPGPRHLPSDDVEVPGSGEPHLLSYNGREALLRGDRTSYPTNRFHRLRQKAQPLYLDNS